MIVNKIEEITVFESPDGGKTIYRREGGRLNKTAVADDPENQREQRWLEWRDILKASETDATLADLILKAEMIWTLKKHS